MMLKNYTREKSVLSFLYLNFNICMLKLTQVILLVFITGLSTALAQKTSLADSIKNAANIKKGYPAKVEFLKQQIKKIYTTKYEETIAVAHFGFDLADKQKDVVDKADFLRNIGGAYIRKGNIDSASVYYFKGLALLEPLGNSDELGLLYDDMARMYRKLKQPERALGFYDKALKLYETEKNLEGIARINNESGIIFRDKGEYKTAKERFEKSLRIQRHRKDSVGMGYALEFLGNNQLLVKDYKKAEQYLKEALAIRERLNDDFARMLNYTALGEFYKETSRLSLSNGYFQKSNQLAKKIKFADIQKYNYSQIIQNNEVNSDFKEAYRNLKAYNSINDSLYNTQKLKDVEEITTKYETVEKEKKILAQRAKIAEHDLALQNRNQWIFGLSALAIVIASVGFLLYKQQQLKTFQIKKESELKLALSELESRSRLEQQRSSISRDLHDNIGAQLTFIISAIDTIKHYIGDKNAKLTNQLDHIGAFARETIQELRDTIWAMNKSSITLADLKARIANFIEKATQAQNSVQISLSIAENVPKDLNFTALEGLNIYRIMQEAINNAIKYADATQIIITIEKTAQLTFKISDNGKGFVENEVETGNGLLNMRKRALELNSKLNLNSTDQNGTSITFSLNENVK